MNSYVSLALMVSGLALAIFTRPISSGLGRLREVMGFRSQVGAELLLLRLIGVTTVLIGIVGILVGAEGSTADVVTSATKGSNSTTILLPIVSWAFLAQQKWLWSSNPDQHHEFFDGMAFAALLLACLSTVVSAAAMFGLLQHDESASRVVFGLFVIANAPAFANAVAASRVRAVWWAICAASLVVGVGWIVSVL